MTRGSHTRYSQCIEGADRARGRAEGTVDRGELARLLPELGATPKAKPRHCKCSRRAKTIALAADRVGWIVVDDVNSPTMLRSRYCCA